MVELASDTFVCIVDESKLVDGLGGSKGMQVDWHYILMPLYLSQGCACYHLNKQNFSISTSPNGMLKYSCASHLWAVGRIQNSHETTYCIGMG